MISVRFQGKPFIITVIQVYAPTSNTEEAEGERFYEHIQDLLELTPKKDVLFITGDRNAKVGSQETPGVTGKFGLGMRNEAETKRVLPRKCTGHSKHPLPTTQDSTHGHHQMVDMEMRLIIFFAAKGRSSIESAKTRLGADCGSDNELFIPKFKLKLKKVGKTTKLFRYDLNQIQVRNRFKGLDLIDRVPDELRMEVCDIV